MQALTKDTAKFVETRIDDEVVVMALDTGDFFSLQDTARAIWDLIDGTRGRDAIVEAMATQYRRDAVDVTPEIDAFLSDLRSSGLVRES